MKMSDRRLKRILRENPMPVQPKKKEEMLELARTCDEKQEELEDGSSMKYIKMKKVRTLIAAAVILSLTAVAVTAGIVNYYYRTPGGQIFNQSGEILNDTGDITMKMTGEPIRGAGFTIVEVSWVSVGGNSTFTVWTTADSKELPDLHARYGDSDYPLKKSFVTKDKDGNPLYIGYAAVDFPEPDTMSPENFKNTLRLLNEEPFLNTSIHFEPDDIAPISVNSGDITMSAYFYNDILYYGVKDNFLPDSVLSEVIRYTDAYVGTVDFLDTDGKEIEVVQRYHSGEGGIADIFCELPSGCDPASLSTNNIHASLTLSPIENVTYCEIPIPEIGETLNGEWVIFDHAGIRRTITSVTRDNKYSISFHSPEEAYMYADQLPEGVLSENVSFVSFSVSTRPFDKDAPPMKSTTTKSGFGRSYRAASEDFPEYCKTHDTIRFGVYSIEVTYSGDWTLEFNN